MSTLNKLKEHLPWFLCGALATGIVWVAVELSRARQAIKQLRARQERSIESIIWLEKQKNFDEKQRETLRKIFETNK